MGYLNYELDRDESFLMLVRKHPIALIFPLVGMMISIAFALVFLIKFAYFQYKDIIAIIWIVTSIIYGVYKVVMWHLDCCIITDKRIVDINQKSLFGRVVSEAGVREIAEAIYEVNGILPAIFRYGNVKIKIANGGGYICMEGVRKPKRIRDLITKIREIQ